MMLVAMIVPLMTVVPYPRSHVGLASDGTTSSVTNHTLGFVVRPLAAFMVSAVRLNSFARITRSVRSESTGCEPLLELRMSHARASTIVGAV